MNLIDVCATFSIFINMFVGLVFILFLKRFIHLFTLRAIYIRNVIIILFLDRTISTFSLFIYFYFLSLILLQNCIDSVCIFIIWQHMATQLCCMLRSAFRTFDIICRSLNLNEMFEIFFALLAFSIFIVDS